jgi:hypothetical protein
MKKAIFCLTFFTLTKTTAQQWLGISNSNYGGTYSIYQNPAHVADSRHKFILNLAGANLSIANNYASWKAPYSVVRLVTGNVQNQYKAPNGKAIWRDSYVGTRDNLKNASALINTEVRGPAMLYTNDKWKFAVALHSRIRVLTNLNQASTDVGTLIIKGTKAPILSGTTRNDNHYSLNANYLNETAFTFGVVLKEAEENFYKVGFTAKRISSGLNIHSIGNDIDYKITNLANNKQLITLLNAQGLYGVAAQNQSFTADWAIQNALNFNNIGIGYGGDIGFVYEYRPDYIKYQHRYKGKEIYDPAFNKYKYRISLALLDVGLVNYANQTAVSQVFIDQQNVDIQPGTFNKIKNTDELLQSMTTVFNPSNTIRTFKSRLPMSLSANIDYQVNEKIYVNAAINQSLRDPDKIGMIQPSMVSVVPRFEKKYYEFGLPITLQNGYKNFTMGIYARAGGFFVGSDNLGGFLNIGSPRGLDAYFGLFIPFYRQLPAEPDNCYSESGKRPKNWLTKRQIKRNWGRIR